MDMGPPTDLIQHRTRIKPGTPIYRARVKKLLTEKEWHLRNLAIAGLETGVYEYCVVANGELSRWGANAVLVTKPGEAVPRLTFNYHYVHEEPAGSQMTLMQQNHDFLLRLTHQVYSSFDLKNGYWAVEIHPEDRHYLAFTVPALGQLQPTRIAQGARSSAHTMNELGLLAFGAIPPPQPEKSFLHAPTPKDLADISFYIDDLSAAHSDWEKHWDFIANHLLPRLEWAMMRLSLRKVKIGMNKIEILGETHEAGGKRSMKPDRVLSVLEFPVPYNATEARGFHGVVQTARDYIKNFSEISEPIRAVMAPKSEWHWGQVEQLSFDLLKELTAAATMNHGYEPDRPTEMYADASGKGGCCFIRQRQGKPRSEHHHPDGQWVPLLYDSFSFNKAERNYGTYKRELRALTFFAKKH
ncbi:unnamed protein product [Zymoseptoria tritici ST99CH_3D1]|nr:unnamed protein product [Zymoseptoria tritici ST99CH_3D1]